MRSVKDILEVLRRERPELERRFGVRRVALFGSWARGEQQPDSDVDILVDVDPAIGLRFVDLAEYLEATLGVRTEVVSRRALGTESWRLISTELLDVA